MSGEKQVEFRKRPVADDVTHILIYATKPVSAVIGAFAIQAQETSTPERLWQMFGDIGGISWEDFWNYFWPGRNATGILIGEVYSSPNHIDIGTQLGVKRPPQSYQYITKLNAVDLLANMHFVHSIS